MKMTEWKYDADDFVQETTLQFLSHNYCDLDIKHQKNIAKKIMRNLFVKNKIDDAHQRIVFRRPVQVYENPVNSIDLTSLQFFLKERNDYQVNIFWLYNIGYTLEELQGIFSLERNSVHCMIFKGKKKLRKILKGECVNGKEATRLNWNKRRTPIPFVPLNAI